MAIRATPAVELQHEVEQFLYREARLLDGGQYRAWLDLFTEDARYWMPTRETTMSRDDEVRKEDELALFDDDKTFLTARVMRLETGLAHAEQPASRTRRFLSNVEVVSRSPDEVDVYCNLIVYQSRLERTESVWVGRREDRLRQVDGTWHIAARKVVMDQTLFPRAMSIFF